MSFRTRGPTHAPDEKSLKETRFTRVPPLPNELYTGIVNDDQFHVKGSAHFQAKAVSTRVRLRCVTKSGGSKAEVVLLLGLHVIKNISDDSMTVT